MHLTSKSSTIICEMRKPFLLIEACTIKIQALYILSAAIVRANNLPRIADASNYTWPLVYSAISSNYGGRTRLIPSHRTPTMSSLATSPSGEMSRRKQ